MKLILIPIGLVAVGLAAWRLRIELVRRRLNRMQNNEYRTAVTIWEFARTVKGHLDQVSAGRAKVIDFTKIVIPRGSGYSVSLELTGYGFHVFAIPQRYNNTGRLSLFVDNSLTVRAGDRAGGNAGAEDPEYTGEEHQREKQ